MLRVFRCGVRLPVFRAPGARFYAQGAPRAQVKPATGLDRSMVRPLVWVIVFGSLVTHVLGRRQEFADMEKRYALKTEILEGLLARARQGDAQVTEQLVERELALVNRMFVSDKSLGAREVEAALAKVGVAPRGQPALPDDSKASLEEVWKGILEDAQAEVEQVDVQEVEAPVDVSSHDDIVLDRAALRRLREAEQDEGKDFAQSTDQHLIVENPGDLSSSARFL